MAKTEETRYVCDVCGFEHKWKESIIEHMKGHVSIKIISSEFKAHETQQKKNKNTYAQDKCSCGRIKSKEAITCRKCYLDDGCSPVKYRNKLINSPKN